MRKDDEMTSGRIQKKLEKRGITVSSSTVRRSRKEQGWTLQRTTYCQLIRDANKVKRLEFAQCVLESGDTFHNVIFSDECCFFRAIQANLLPEDRRADKVKAKASVKGSCVGRGW